MIQFDNVSLAFSHHPLFDKISFSVNQNEKCALLGRNGSGKSTILRMIAGEIEPDEGTITISRGYRIGYLEQHIRFSEDTIIKEAALGLNSQEKDQLYKAEKILFGLGFSEKDLERDPGTLSGGFHLRLHLAKVLIAEPDCLLLDEPTNYLDILSLRFMTNFLKKWRGEFILISHDRNFLDSVSNHTMGLHREKMRKMRGSTGDYFKQILLEEEVHEKTRLKGEKRKVHMESYIERFGAKASKASQAQSKMKMLEKEPSLEKLNKISELSFSFHEAPFMGKKMLEAHHLKFSFTGEPLIEDFSFEIEKGQRVGIIGKNGRGKSTLLRLIGQDLLPQAGSLKVSENTKMGFFGQTHVDRLQPRHTIVEEIALANHSLSYKELRAIAGAMMFSGKLGDKKIEVLSGGERSRVLLGKILSKPCNLLLLDEPTHHLDIESIEALIDALEEFSFSIVIVTHSELILRRLNLDKIILCEEAKQTQFLGNYDEFLEKIGWEEEKAKEPAPPKKDVSKPVEKEIRDCEKKLALLVEEKKKVEGMMAMENSSEDLFRSYDSLNKQIEQLEAKLYKLYENIFAKKN